MAAIVRRTTADGTGVSPLGRCASYTLAVIAPRPRSSPLARRAPTVGRLHARSIPALAGADLDVEAGEIVLLSGANGAGKTTLLRLCAGLLPLRSGEAEVLGVDLRVDRRPIRRALALV